ncbi:hypothetical protein [Acetobacter nitrogenifigens]|uniref:hypothetical protein n=1 Tax=Acetobacter nitrogenifigens TaxID=285268 RepID=UPI0012B583B4|nr:hypothetical protein [Acetobacter nitrogenifigens]
MILPANVGYLVNPYAAIIEKIMTESLVNATPDNPEVREGIGIVERICDKPFRQQIDGDFGNELSAIKPGRGSGYQAMPCRTAYEDPRHCRYCRKGCGSFSAARIKGRCH